MKRDPMRVLIVEDERDYARLVQKWLSRGEQREIKLERVETLAMGIQRVRRQTFDVVILDLGLPDSKGADTVARLHAEARHLPIVVLSGLEDQTTIYEAVKHGAQEYLVKDPSAKQLLPRAVRYAIEHKQAEETLEEDKDLLFALMDSIPDSIYFKDAGSRFTMVNKHKATKSGLAHPREAVGKTDFDFFAEEHARQAYEDEKDVMTSGRPLINKEEKETWPDGSETWVSTTKMPLFNKEKEIIGTFGVSRDITKRKQAEIALQESQERYLALFEQAADSIVLVDVETGELVEFNEKAHKNLGYTREEFRRLKIPDFEIVESAEDVAKHIETIVRNGSDIFETRHRTKEGRERSILVSSRAITIHGRDFVQSMWRDITERKRAEDALKESEERHRFLIEQAPAGVIRADSEGQIVHVNTSLLKMLGSSSPEATLAINILTFPPLVDAGIAEDVRTCLDTGTPISSSRWYTSKSGKRSFMQMHVKPTHDAGGNVTGVLAVVTDTTEQKRAEEERRKIETQVQQTQKLESLGVLAGGIAHDFNNLLMGILGNADLVLSNLPHGSVERERTEGIQTAGKRAADLCNQLLAYSGRGKFVTEALDVSSVVKEISHLLQISISKNVTLKYDLPMQLPLIEGDATQIRQIVMNLITNASDAFQDKSGLISVMTGAMECDRTCLIGTQLGARLPEGSYVYVEVTDGGCGMDDDTKSRMFDPLFSTKFAGRGLGLAAVLGIVRSHRGAISVHSQPGRGTRFRVLLPVSRKAVKMAEQRAVISKEWQGSGTVLLVDDEETVRTVAKRMLQQIGFDVLMVNDGREAVDMLLKHKDRIRIVLLDMTMPHLGGVEALNEMRKIRCDIPVILSSGYSEHDAIERFAGKEPAAFIQKPYQLDAIRKKLREALS